MDKTLNWSAFEYHEKAHSVDWYWGVGLVTLIIVLASFYFKNYLFGFLIIIGVSTLVYLTFRKPKEVGISIDDKGVRVRNELFPYRNLKSFWIEEEPQRNGDRHLLLTTTRVYSPLLALPLGDVAPETIRQALLSYKLEEKETHENPSHHFIEMLGF
jgi:hypothetical protein